ncbi:hypothetical protein DOTSEDRAFT_22520 [Dothistroma septosporum NZE10]|uniref:Uncharacterized protein n=1 Tax=Dothistroma septosporum (strain NZE10 / CBS 128990) TaxID=675120 RepID=N1PU35_DOTSN|nr:hypothetical protein DOTSEDRAFT_22520 [Dothistroma septosporum NZE10]
MEHCDESTREEARAWKIIYEELLDFLCTPAVHEGLVYACGHAEPRVAYVFGLGTSAEVVRRSQWKQNDRLLETSWRRECPRYGRIRMSPDDQNMTGDLILKANLHVIDQGEADAIESIASGTDEDDSVDNHVKGD